MHNFTDYSAGDHRMAVKTNVADSPWTSRSNWTTWTSWTPISCLTRKSLLVNQDCFARPTLTILAFNIVA
jgi:hypothetical protein